MERISSLQSVMRGATTLIRTGLPVFLRAGADAGLSTHRRHQFLEAHQIQHAFEIVDQRRQAPGQCLERIDFCGSTGFGVRSMYVFMMSVFLSSVVWGVSPTTGGSAPCTRRNPRLFRRADTLCTFIASHTV